jgi:thymidylate synthase
MFNINITSNIYGFCCGFLIHIAWYIFDKWDIYNNYIINQIYLIISYLCNKLFLISDKLLTEIALLFYNKNYEELQYLDLIKKILNEGTTEMSRNGKVLSIFGNSMRFSLKDGKIPILTTKKVAWKTCLKELLWFINGETDNMSLTSQGVHIWDGNSSKEYMKTRGLSHYSEGLLGPIYGYQWRYYNAPYNHLYGIPKLKENEKPLDQLQNIIDQLKNPETRNSRRLILTAWNPLQLDDMALPPCHILCQFNVHDGNKLSCAMFQRSNDECCGTSFNIASYSFLTHLLAKHCGLEAYEFVYFKGNCHIYEDHIEGANTQITREPFQFPTVSIKEVRENINDYKVEDFEIHNYHHHPQIKFQMVA